jgi:hypothetical protein
MAHQQELGINMITYKYKNFPRGKDIILDIDSIIDSNPKKIIFHSGTRWSSKIYCDVKSYKVLSTSFDVNGKPIDQHNDYCRFLQSVINKSEDSIVLQKSTWSYFILLLLSSLVMLSVAVIMSFVAYDTFGSYGLVRKFYFHVAYALLPLVISFLGIMRLRKPVTLSKELLLKVLFEGA